MDASGSRILYSGSDDAVSPLLHRHSFLMVVTVTWGVRSIRLSLQSFWGMILWLTSGASSGRVQELWEPCSGISSTKPLFRSMHGLIWQGYHLPATWTWTSVRTTLGRGTQTALSSHCLLLWPTSCGHQDHHVLFVFPLPVCRGLALVPWTWDVFLQTLTISCLWLQTNIQELCRRFPSYFLFCKQSVVMVPGSVCLRYLLYTRCSINVSRWKVSFCKIKLFPCGYT